MLYAAGVHKEAPANAHYISVPVKEPLSQTQFVAILGAKDMQATRYCQKIPKNSTVMRWVMQYERVDAQGKADMLTAKSTHWPMFLVYAIGEVSARARNLRQQQMEAAKLKRRHTALQQQMDGIRRKRRQTVAANSRAYRKAKEESEA